MTATGPGAGRPAAAAAIFVLSVDPAARAEVAGELRVRYAPGYTTVVGASPDEVTAQLVPGARVALVLGATPSRGPVGSPR